MAIMITTTTAICLNGAAIGRSWTQYSIKPRTITATNNDINICVKLLN